MSCACALVLSVTLAFFSGIGLGSKQDILFKGGVSIESLAGVRAVALDTTGTVTKGAFTLQQVVGDENLLAICAACEQNSTHPVAQSIVAAAENISLKKPDTVEELSGRGIRATLEGKTVLCGNPRLLEEHGVDTSAFAPNRPGTHVLVAVDGAYRGYLTIADSLKPVAAEAVTRLREMGITAAMLTGDNEDTARAVGQATGINEIHARLLPQDKLEVLGRIRARRGPTTFVGDGINDAPVLAGADVGAAMGSGADAAIEAADVVFMTSAPEAIPEAIAIARSTQAIAWQNVVFALGVKLVVMILGLLGFANMWMAVFADSGVAMLCVLNAIRLLHRGR
jgi:Cd2+/Zn2+-exporting ATPase